MRNIKNIQIWNFRGIDTLEISDCNKINVLIGKNNVGKSSILESIFLTSGMSNSELPLKINLLRDINPQSLSNLKYLFYNMDTQLHPSVKLVFSNDYERGLTLSPLTQTISDLAVSAKTVNSGTLKSMIGLLLDFYEIYPGKVREQYQSKLDFLANGAIVPSNDKDCERKKIGYVDSIDFQIRFRH